MRLKLSKGLIEYKETCTSVAISGDRFFYEKSQLVLFSYKPRGIEVL